MLQLGLEKTGLFEDIEKSGHIGGTLFAPSNYAFKKLGPKINAFLFSKYGLKYLRALLEYHIVANTTLYSDAIYRHRSKNSEEVEGDTSVFSHMTGPPYRRFHIDLPTILYGKHLSIDILRWSRFISFVINGFNHVAVLDGVAKDGVLHVVPNVLIPPKTPGATAEILDREWTVEEFVERLSPLVENGRCGEL
ncbi:hypothetical protein GP486_008372 [Trichoglossum hirsutum]|uniref:FAS1 domain-containing protein n=1 Tax=Trichoglossum hirsutum TaxID=265104 RepID=A0A9P8IA49_9PEZI|nr:hypothetical protein GP486_008372 [Trichoglossum hirsutum]